MLHGSQEWGGKGLGRLTISMKSGLGVSHGSREWDGKGMGRLKMKHEKGFGCFMVPKRGVGRVCEIQKWSLKRGVAVGCSMVHKSGVGRAWEGSKWFPRVLWEWFGKAQNEA